MTKLNDILEELYTDGLQQPGKPQKRTLNKGLHLAVIVKSEGAILKIARDREYPSAREWETVCNYFPYYVGNPTPARIIDSDKRFALKADLPARSFKQLEFAPTVDQADETTSPPIS